MEKKSLGLQPYTEEDAYRFKGRSQESIELFRQIVRNDYTVCYAESGEGKTSLLNAGVFPLLRENMYFPIAITFTNDDYKSTPDSFDLIIDRCIKDSLDEYNMTNKGIRIEYKLCDSDFIGVVCQERLQTEIAKYSWWKLRNYKPQVMGLMFTPVFVFDQFEEVFNMPESIVWTKTFFDWLEEISSDSCPDYIIQKVRNIIGYNVTFPTIKEEKSFKAIFSLRKEFIGELDYWGMQTHFIPSLKDNRYCLKALTYDGAKEVMIQQEQFQESKVEHVLHYFLEKYSKAPEKTTKKKKLPCIPAMLVSVVCDSWEKDINYFSNIEEKGIDQSLNHILDRFYIEVLDSVVQELTQQNPDIQPGQLLRDIESALFTLIDVNNKRVRTKTTTANLSLLDFTQKYQKILSKTRLIKVTKIDGEDYVEIVHDALCPTIVRRKELRFNEEIEELDKEKRRKANYKCFLSHQNPLTLVGRQIWDNKGFTFSIDNTRRSSLQNSSSRTEALKDLLQQRNKDDNGVEHLFFNKIYSQTRNVGKISLAFNGSYSKDGISIFEIESERVGSNKQLKIKKISFKDSKDNAFYTADGFCGIMCEYDKDTGNEIKREYICDGYTCTGITAIKFEDYNEYDFPTKINYFNSNNVPCQHIDGNYGLRIEYDDYGREICRWFLNQNGDTTSIYNGVYGIACKYDKLDRIIKQYFIDRDGKRVFDNYGFHGIEFRYSEAPNELLVSETIYIDENDFPCNSPYGFCVEQLQYDDQGRVLWQSYLDKDRKNVEMNDGVYSYSNLKIGYNESDKPDNLAMYNLTGNIFKINRYSYDLNGNISEFSCWELKRSQSGLIERESKLDDNEEHNIHKITFKHDNHGFLVCLQYFDKSGNSTNNINGHSKQCFLYNNLGMIVESRAYNFEKSVNDPISRTTFRYNDDNISELIETDYKIITATKTTGKILERINKKKEEKYAVENEQYSIKCLLNHRGEFIKMYLDENNEYVRGTSLTVRRKYDFRGNIVEELLYDKDDKSPICDEKGAYGWRYEYDARTSERNRITYLGKNAQVANNKNNYAIEAFSYEIHGEIKFYVTSYFDEDNKATFCKEGYHKMLEKLPLREKRDPLCKTVIFKDCFDKLCNCVNGYAIQIFEEELINQNETKLTVSFWGADTTPKINNEYGFHKREQLICTESECMEKCCSFWDENNSLINVEGYAKRTIKQYDSFWTLFHYPFNDYKVIRFYDKNEQKVDVDINYVINTMLKKTLHADYQVCTNSKQKRAYKFIVSLDDTSVFKLTNSAGETLSIKKSLLWRWINIIWIPPVVIFLIILFMLFSIFKWLYNLFKPKQITQKEYATIIQIAQIVDNISNGDELVPAPIKQFDVQEGDWIVKWNNWSYNIHQDVATTFETEFNDNLERKAITIYNSSEKKFLDIDITSPNIGLRIHVAQVSIKEVEEMIRLWNL